MKVHGYLDAVDRYRIAGWCRDEDDPDQAISLVVTINGDFAMRVLANAFRHDLIAQGAGGHLSFDIYFETPLSPLVRATVDIRSEIDGSPLIGSPFVIEPAKTFDPDMRRAIASAVVSPETEADADERLGFLADQFDSVLRAKDRLRSAPKERAARRKAAWRKGHATKDVDGTTPPRALVIDVWLPVATRDAGSIAILSHLQSLVRLGYEVSFVPTNLDPGATDAALHGIAVLSRPWYASVEEVLASHADTFDVVYLHRSQVAAFYAPLVRLHQPSARLVFAVADLSSMRVQRQAETEDRPELLHLSRYDAMLEKHACDWADAIITHSSLEATVLRQRLGRDVVHVVPFAVPSRESRVPLASRSGLAFIGSFGHAPNVDAALWLADGIMPVVSALNPSIQAFLVGSAMPEHVRALSSASVIPLGPVDDLSLIFDRVRLTVAPLAYGAGVKGKVLDSLAAGVPCVCTPIAAEGLDLPEPLSSLVANDIEGLAALIVRLHDDDAYNAECAVAGRSYIVSRASEHAVDVALRNAVSRSADHGCSMARSQNSSNVVVDGSRANIYVR